MPSVGDIAPEFEMKNQQAQMVTLSSMRGKKVLLAFFPYAFSGTCSVEFGCFRDDLSQFKSKNVEVVGVSVDSHHAMRAFSEAMKIEHPMLSDFSKAASRAYGVLRSDGASERAYFVVDEQGKIIFKHVMEALGQRLENSDLLAALK